MRTQKRYDIGGATFVFSDEEALRRGLDPANGREQNRYGDHRSPRTIGQTLDGQIVTTANATAAIVPVEVVTDTPEPNETKAPVPAPEAPVPNPEETAIETEGEQMGEHANPETADPTPVETKNIEAENKAVAPDTTDASNKARRTRARS